MDDEELLAKVRRIGPQPGYPMKVCRFRVQPIPLDALVCKFCTREVNTDKEAEALMKIYLTNYVKEYDKRRRKRIATIIITILIIGFFILISRH
jgi:hypothetical protein